MFINGMYEFTPYKSVIREAFKGSISDILTEIEFLRPVRLILLFSSKHQFGYRQINEMVLRHSDVNFFKGQR